MIHREPTDPRPHPWPLRLQRLEGPPMQAWAWTFTPLAGRLELHLPGLVASWIVPLAVRASHPDGRREIHPVVDVTRGCRWGLLAAGLLAAAGLAGHRMRRGGDRHHGGGEER